MAADPLWQWGGRRRDDGADRWARLVRAAPSWGAISQRPCSGPPSRAAKQAGLSNRGQHSQFSEPSRPTSAAVSQSPIRA